MIGRIFDAANDSFMGVVVAKTNTKWDKYRPWLLTRPLLSAFILYGLSGDYYYLTDGWLPRTQ
ncbi:MFS transporter [Globicatella sulfidifaciens]|uniref:MFS transporter n=1 Tax=Globicatella sulfidifaciens TaxID=136093 RepID=UPI00135648BD